MSYNITSPLSSEDLHYRKIYFVGAGGIGMANLVRYCLNRGLKVAGYDRTSTILTDTLRKEGADIIFEDDPGLIGLDFRDPQTTLVVYTPAVGDDNNILSMFRREGFEIIKRAELLGRLTRKGRAICVAGSHGKTTTTSMIANILRTTKEGCNAFLGGILRNTGSNLLLSDRSDRSVVEADEYDRSFHRLSPYIAVITSADPDHLDIYGDAEHYREAFSIFTSLIKPEGTLILHSGVDIKPECGPEVKVYTYSGKISDYSEGHNLPDFRAENIRFLPGRLLFDFVGPKDLIIKDIELGVPVEINVDNAVAAAAASLIAGATPEEVKHGLKTFMGAKRRFEILMGGSRVTDGNDEEKIIPPVLIDDYAHSPNEVRASIESVRKLYPGLKLTVIFQPHLYTRTRDFAKEFAEALSAADEVIMPEIYPAREAPIPGVDSKIILKDIKCAEKRYCERKDLLNLIKNSNFDILMTLGAADIDLILPETLAILQNKKNNRQ